jgi:hypothetical protein
LQWPSKERTFIVNSFEQMGEAQLAAFEGRRQIGRAIARALGRALARLGQMVERQLSVGGFAPW